MASTVTAEVVGVRLHPTAVPLLLAAGYVAVVGSTAARLGAELHTREWLPIPVFLAALTLLAVLVAGMVRRRPVREVLVDVPGALACQTAVTLLMVTYACYRPVMQIVVPFWADGALTRLDYWLHLGHHPYTLIPHWPRLTYLLDELYGPMWVTLGPVAVVGWSWCLRGWSRTRAFALFIGWMSVSTILATLLDSAGPVYAERLGVTDAFVPLTDYLGTLNLRASHGHEFLWRGYMGVDIAHGITAMPSGHVALPLIVTLTVWQHRWLRAAGLASTALILLGSVHLGWHYAVDGYVSLAGVWLIWRAVNRLIPEHLTPPLR